MDGDKDTLFSQNYACEDCGISMPELSPRMFSFNNPYGACPVCSGLGTQQVADPLLIIPDRSKSILQGAIQASGWNNVRDDSISRMYFEALAKKYHFSLNDPIESLPQQALDVESESQIKSALDHLVKGRTTFIVAHRLSTIRDADRIVVMQNGRIAEIGNHRELLALDGIYADMNRKFNAAQ